MVRRPARTRVTCARFSASQTLKVFISSVHFRTVCFTPPPPPAPPPCTWRECRSGTSGSKSWYIWGASPGHPRSQAKRFPGLRSWGRGLSEKWKETASLQPAQESISDPAQGTPNGKTGRAKHRPICPRFLMMAARQTCSRENVQGVDETVLRHFILSGFQPPFGMWFLAAGFSGSRPW